jgi:hypothetical protein
MKVIIIFKYHKIKLEIMKIYKMQMINLIMGKTNKFMKIIVIKV